MTPWQIAKTNEQSHQTALFCFAAKAQKIGFEMAKDPKRYVGASPTGPGYVDKVPELKWLHAINNGVRSGDEYSRKVEGGALKAAGVKAGVLDIFWPLVRWNQQIKDGNGMPYCGLYIEMKKPALKSKTNPHAGCSDEQNEFGEFVTKQGYHAVVCYSWEEAAKELQNYYQL